MNFYDDLAEQLEQARLTLDAEQAAEAKAAATGRPRRSRRRLAGLAAVASILAVVVFVALSTDTRTTIARAGLAILETESVDASGIKVDSDRVTLANLRTAHPFDTPRGTGYAYLSRQRGGVVSVCVSIPDALEPNEPYATNCKPRAEAEAKGISVQLIGEEGSFATSVVVLPEGTATLRYQAEGESIRTLPSVNGVVAFQVRKAGRLSWDGAHGAGVQRDEVIPAFAKTRLRFECRDGTKFYVDEDDFDRLACRPFGGLKQLMGIPVPQSEREIASGEYLDGPPTTP